MEKALSNQEDLGGGRGMTDDIFDESYCEKKGPKPARRYVWRNIILMSLLHLGALYGLWLIRAAKPVTLAWGFLCFLLSALGVTAGAHRLWSHRSYKASLPLRIFLAIANSMAFQNDIYEWARDHRVHHKFSETDADPHNAKRGFFFSHVGWLLVRKHPDVIEKGQKLDLADLKADKVVMFQRRFYKLSVVVMCFLFPTLVPWCFWGESLRNSFFLPAILRYVLVLNATWLVNSAAHMFGNRPYDRNINPRENRLVTFGALGEGFHNYHHTFPYDYSTSEFGWHYNFTTAFIDLMFYKLSVVVMCFLFPTLVPWCFWGESLRNSFFLPAILRYVLVLNATWLVNSAAHMFGNRPYDRNINPRENRLVTFGALGEGFHNYHHTFPYDYSTSEFGWHYNFTTAFIDLMCLLGLASDRKKVSKETILARKTRTGDGSHNG
ncbi:Acyl-CoA desaturase [Chelonia mydas]|uniref:stearoyl-CoA 9-desaturase n=1 Tax=Chelonia mydas TaxID=8469 RepID=M7AGI6_CHEMY|nr:Acyl-CoA desaturase [Chelonia mydas]